GALWVVEGPAGPLRRVGLWHKPHITPPAEDVAADPRTGLACVVRQTGKATWRPDYSATGGHGARLTLAFPVALHEEGLGGLELRGPKTCEPDADLLETISNVGTQIGHYPQRRRVEQAICESEARKAAVLEAAVDAIITIDRAGKILEFNPAAEAIFR